MYESHWNLDRKPFENDLNVAFFFEGKHHREAQVRVLYAAEQKKPLALLIGESGVGKTMVCRSAAAQLEKRGYPVGWVSAAGLDQADLVRTVALAMGVEDVGAGRAEALAQLTTTIRKRAEKNQHSVLFIDNVECMGEGRGFDELRTLLDATASADGAPMLTIVLSGHPRVRGTLKRRHSLVQRLEVGYELVRLEPEEARAYMLHRLHVAGAPESLFDEGAIDRAAVVSEGTPRLLNRVCDLALLMGMIEKKEQVNAKLIDDAAEEMNELRKIGAGEGGGREERGERGGRPDEGRDDEDRDEGDGDEGGEGDDRRGGRRRRRRRGRGGRGDERADERGERRGERRPAPVAADDEADESGESYAFNADEHRDIESMTEIIQGSLKVVSGGSQRRRRGGKGRAERGDPLQYFDSPVNGGAAAVHDVEDEADAALDAPPASEAEGGERRGRRRRRRRGGRGRGAEGAGDEGPIDDEREARSEPPLPPPARDDRDDEFAAGIIDDEPPSREAARAEAAPHPTASRPERREPPRRPAPAPAQAPDDFAAGLFEDQ